MRFITAFDECDFCMPYVCVLFWNTDRLMLKRKAFKSAYSRTYRFE